MAVLMRTIKTAFWLIFILATTAACTFAPDYVTYPTRPIYIPPAAAATITRQPLLGTKIPSILPSETPVFPTPGSGFSQGEWIILPEAGFAFSMPVNPAMPDRPYTLLQEARQASLASPDQVLLISIRSSEDSQATSTEACLELVLERMIADLGDVIPKEPEPAWIGSYEALSRRVDGDMLGEDFTGQLVSTLLKPGTCLSALAVTLGTEADTRWEQEGSPALSVILSSMVIDEIEQVSSVCQISTDPQYGINQDKPIRVGNTNLYDGLTREEAYLSALRGPVGQKLAVERVKTVLNDAGDILDMYEITYADLEKPITLYLDMYLYETPLAPLGFTCPQDIPLGAP